MSVELRVYDPQVGCWEEKPSEMLLNSRDKSIQYCRPGCITFDTGRRAPATATAIQAQRVSSTALCEDAGRVSVRVGRRNKLLGVLEGETACADQEKVMVLMVYEGKADADEEGSRVYSKLGQIAEQ